MRMWYQSDVDDENGTLYWDVRRADLTQIVDPGTDIDVHGMTPYVIEKFLTHPKGLL